MASGQSNSIRYSLLATRYSPFAILKSSQQMNRVRRQQPDRHEGNADDAETARDPSERDHAGDDCRGGEHDTDLERRRREFVIVIARQRGLAVLLGGARL